MKIELKYDGNYPWCEYLDKESKDKVIDWFNGLLEREQGLLKEIISYDYFLITDCSGRFTYCNPASNLARDWATSLEGDNKTCFQLYRKANNNFAYHVSCCPD